MREVYPLMTCNTILHLVTSQLLSSQVARSLFVQDMDSNRLMGSLLQYKKSSSSSATKKGRKREPWSKDRLQEVPTLQLTKTLTWFFGMFMVR